MKATKIEKIEDVSECGDQKNDLHVKESLLHAVEAAEKAVIHAVRDEVDNLFHDNDHTDTRTVSRKTNYNRSRKQQPVCSSQNCDRNRFGWGLDQSTGF